MKCLLIGGTLDGKTQEVAGAPEKIYYKIHNDMDAEEYIRAYVTTSTTEHPGFTETKIVYAHNSIAKKFQEAIIERLKKG